MRKLTQEEFEERANKVHDNKFGYTKSKYVNNRTKVNITCPEHGDFKQIAETHLYGGECFKCGINKRIKTKTLTQEEFEDRGNKIHDNKFGYTKSKYKDADTYVIITCSVEGHPDFKQKPSSHLYGRACPLCGINKRTKKKTSSKEEFVVKANKVHGEGRYGYDKGEYVNEHTKMLMTCSVEGHGDFLQRPSNHIHSKNGCPTCSASKGEIAIAKILEKHSITFIQEVNINNLRLTFKDNNYRYDFYLGWLRILIEFHGIQHYKSKEYFGGEEGLKKIQERDLRKIKLAHFAKLYLIVIKYTEFERATEEEFEKLILTKIADVRNGLVPL